MGSRDDSFELKDGRFVKNGDLVVYIAMSLRLPFLGK